MNLLGVAVGSLGLALTALPKEEKGAIDHLGGGEQG